MEVTKKQDREPIPLSFANPMIFICAHFAKKQLKHASDFISSSEKKQHN